MRIDKVSLGVYGEKKNLDLDFTCGNFLLVHGENEAGKSTLLSFIRNALFGSQKKSDDSDAPFAMNENVARGALDFQLADRRLGRIVRRWKLDKKGSEESELTLAGIDKEPSELGRILGCSDRDFYTNYFGFTYTELSQGANLLVQRELSRLLYGLAAGDMKRLERGRDEFLKRAGELFKSGANAKKLINTAISEYIDLKKQLDSRSNSTSEYKAKLDEREKISSQLVSEEEAKEKAQRVAKRWRTLLNARDAYVDYQTSASEFQTHCDSYKEFAQLVSRLTQEEEEEYREKKQTVIKGNTEIAELSAEIEQREAELDKIDVEYAKMILEYESAINELKSDEGNFKDKNNSLANRRKELQERKKGLVRELAELGALRLDASEEERTAVIQNTRNLLLNAIFDECQDYRDKEEQTCQSLNSKRAIVEQETANFESKKLARQNKLDEFNSEYEGWSLNLSTDEISETASNIKQVDAEFHKLIQEYDALKNAQVEEERFARELLRQANDGDESYDDLVAELSKPVKPLEYAALAQEMETLEQKRNHLEENIASLDADIDKTTRRGQFDQNEYDCAIEELKLRRRQRDEQWEKVQNGLIEREETDLEDRRTLAQRYRCEEEAVDSASDRLFELNRARGESDAFDATLKELRLKRDNRQSELDELKEQSAALDDKAAALWERFGFGRCARWSRTESVEWLKNWQEWRERHTKNEAICASLVDKFTQCERAFLPAAKVIGRWSALDCDVVALDQDYQSESSLARRVEILNEIARALADSSKIALSRAKRYGELCSDIKNLSSNVSELESNVERDKRDYENLRAELAQLSSKCATFCAERGLTLFESIARDWRTLTDAVRRLRKWQEEMNEYDAEREKYEADAQFVECFVDKVAKLATDAFGDSRDAAVDVQRLARALTDAHNAETTYKTIEKDLVSRRNDFEKKVAARDRARERASDIREITGLDSESFGHFLDFTSAYRQMRNQLTEKRVILEARLFPENLNTPRGESLLADLETYDVYELQRKCDEAEKNEREISEFVNQLHQRQGEINKDIEHIEQQQGTITSREQCQDKLCQLRSFIDDYAPLQIASEIIERSLKKFKDEKMPGLREKAGEILKRISNGRYYSIIEDDSQNDKQSEGYVVRESAGATKRPDQLSVGTREQLFLALRLALIAQYDEHSEPLPVLMDDVLVNSDETRARRILQVLNEMATEKRQIILLSCHKSTRDAFEEIVGKESVIELESGIK